ncbi:FkbM family methyltransferase [Pigmentiphaga aceris]|uniref:FkbM family methyltransferase n=1 Tax=Pigmentiphaga aceris TaxID=1940612 RepID=A0A5C0B3A3_9BURK|nr:FkbM family methyltransferase [Pigmentiphaga aceris]QEI07241.1 FkbM family methyltransferase [Pigmentiphaga aceris]
MSNDPRDLDGEKLRKALFLLGRNEALRLELMDWLKRAETRFDASVAVRDDITGPIVDAINTSDDLYEKTLENGTRFKFLFRTKIARDFILADREHPTHVWEPQTTRLLAYLAGHTDGDILIGGAYFGDHAMSLARQIADAGRQVHCFEPDTAQSAMLEGNVELNGLDNVRIHRLGLWRESKQRLRLTGFDSFANAVVADSTEEGFDTVTIDDHFNELQRHCGLLMLDIEGGEIDALQGSAAVLAKDKPAIVFEVHRDYVDWTNGLQNTPICSLLIAAGYDVYALRDFHTNQEMGDRRIELIPAASVYLEGPPHGFNMLAVPSAALLDDPVFRIVENVSPKLLKHRRADLHHPLDGLPE